MKKLILLFILLPLCCFAQTRPDWLDIKNKPIIDPREFGATSGDLTDDTAALQAAQDRALASGGVVIINGGYYIAATPGVTLKADTFGTQGNLLFGPAQAQTSSLYTDVTAPNIVVDGLNMRSVNFDVGSGITIQNCDITQVENFGIRLQGSTLACRAINNRISNVIYGEASSADGIYTAGVVGCVIEKNVIHNIRRIGIVIEANSKHVTVQDNVVYDANNSDDSVGEYNAGIWVENSADVYFLRNKIYDVVGQENSARAWGIVMASNFVGAVGSNTMVLEGNVLDEGLVYLGQGGGQFSVKNNRFEKSHILIKGADPASATSNVYEITNNYIGGPSDNFANSKIWFEGLQNNDDKLIVAENEFEGAITNDGGHILLSPAIPRFLTIENQPEITYFHNRSGTVNALGANLVIRDSDIRVASSTIAGAGPSIKAYNNVTIDNCYLSGHNLWTDGGRFKISDSDITNSQTVAYAAAGSGIEINNCFVYGQLQPLLKAGAVLSVTDSVFANVTDDAGIYAGNIWGLLDGSSATSTMRIFNTMFYTNNPATTTYAIDGDGKTQPAIGSVFFGNVHNHDGLLVGWPGVIATYSIVVP